MKCAGACDMFCAPNAKDSSYAFFSSTEIADILLIYHGE